MSNFVTEQCSSGATQSRPFPARAVKRVVSALQISRAKAQSRAGRLTKGTLFLIRQVCNSTVKPACAGGTQGTADGLSYQPVREQREFRRPRLHVDPAFYDLFTEVTQ